VRSEERKGEREKGRRGEWEIKVKKLRETP
jgi:hypothetical protein